MDVRVVLECRSARTAQRLASHLRASSFDTVNVHAVDPRPSKPSVWQVIGEMDTRPLTEEFFLSVRQTILQVLQEFACTFRSFSASRGRAA